MSLDQAHLSTLKSLLNSRGLSCSLSVDVIDYELPDLCASLLRSHPLSADAVATVIQIGDWVSENQRYFTFTSLASFYQVILSTRPRLDSYLPFDRWLVSLLSQFSSEAEASAETVTELAVVIHDAWSWSKVKPFLLADKKHIDPISHFPSRVQDWLENKWGIVIDEVVRVDQGGSGWSWLSQLFELAIRRGSPAHVLAAICYLQSSSIYFEHVGGIEDHREGVSHDAPLDLRKRTKRHEPFQKTMGILALETAPEAFDPRLLKDTNGFRAALNTLWDIGRNRTLSVENLRAFIFMYMAIHECPYFPHEQFHRRFPGESFP